MIKTNNPKVLTVFACIVLIMSASCKSPYKKFYNQRKNQFHFVTPPGTVQIDSNFYIDKSEMSNLSWLEYVYWNKKIFGAESSEYLASIPDTNAWSTFNSKYIQLDTFYFRHIAYRNHPVVGISHEQARAYSSWRSDRVMEMLLVKNEILEYNPNQNPETVFTIDRFYSDSQYSKYHHLPYPHYDLIDSAHWHKILHVTDSINEVAVPRCPQRAWLYIHAPGKKIYCQELFHNDSLVINSQRYNQTIGRHYMSKHYYSLTPTKVTDCYNCPNANIVYDLRGNLCEMTADSTVSLGGCWYDPIEGILAGKKSENSAPDIFNGFRNTCRWEFYKK